MLSSTNPLADYQWQNRLVLVFSPTADNELYLTQLQAIESLGDGWAERELVLFSVLPKAGTGPKAELKQSEINFLRERFQIEEKDFVVILIGKDGGEKLRLDQSVLTEQKLFPLIDAMPMRQAEIKRSKW
ncbi:MAG: DUF4174 domain-containing protein [Bacteroidia bacterium]